MTLSVYESSALAVTSSRGERVEVMPVRVVLTMDPVLNSSGRLVTPTRVNAIGFDTPYLVEGQIKEARPVRIVASLIAQNSAGNWIDVTPVYVVSGSLSGGGDVPVNSTPVVITGATTEGSILTADSDTWTNGPVSRSYVWYANGIAIPSETASTLNTAGLAGYSITVIVTASNVAGSSQSTSSAVGPLTKAPLNAIAGERDAGGIYFGDDNSAADLVTRAVVFPTGVQATKIDQVLDWHSVFVVRRGGGIAFSSAERETIASYGVLSTGSVNSGSLYLDRTGKLFINRRTSNNGTTASVGDFITGSGSTAIDTGIVLDFHKSYIVTCGQVGNFPVIRACEVYGSGAIQTYTGPDNKTPAPSFYLAQNGAARPSSTFDDMWFAIGWSFLSTNRNGYSGTVSSFAHMIGTLSNADIQAMAAGSLSLGSLTGLRYWNPLVLPASGTSILAKATDRAGNALPVTGAATYTVSGSPALARTTGPLLSGSSIRLNVEVTPYLFPMVPGRTTGRVWWDGPCSATGYAIYGRLLNASDLTDLVPWTQITASHAGDTFAGYVDGVAPAVTFYREVWVGPPTSTIGGSDGHLFSERNPMQLGLKVLGVGQSQFTRLGGVGASGGTQVAAAASGCWQTVRTGFGGSPSDPVGGAAPGTPPGPREINRWPTGTGVGDGLIDMMNRISADLGWSVDLALCARAGHPITAFVYDRINTSKVVSGSGTSRTTTLQHADIVGTTYLAGVEPGSIVVTTANLGVFTDIGNAAMTGSQLLNANTQVIPAQTGLIGTNTINYYSGALVMNFTGDPGAVTVSWMTRFDTSEGSAGSETTPDKFTLFGSTALNGHIHRMSAVSPRHGYSFVLWDGATSNLGDVSANTETGYQAGKAKYSNWLDLLIQRVWNELDPTGMKPPLLVGIYGRADGETTGEPNMRRAQDELSLEKTYVPGSATDGSSNATITAYRWHKGINCNYSLNGNIAEHQDAQSTGGRRMGEQSGQGCVSLALGDLNRVKGPRFLSANIKVGNPKIIEVTPTFYRTGATALVTDFARIGTAGSIPAGDTANLKGWQVTICAGPTPTDAEMFAITAGESLLVSLNGTTGKVEITRSNNADWPAIASQALIVRYKSINPFLTYGGGEATRLADETAMASNLYDNAGGYGTQQPGAESAPVFGLVVT